MIQEPNDGKDNIDEDSVDFFIVSDNKFLKPACS